MKKHVLICEDDEGIIDVATIVLEEKGYTVEAVTKGSTIYERIKKQIPDIILLDLWMPEISGEEIARKLKGDDNTKHIPIVIVSASKDIEKIAAMTHVNAFLPKPFDIYELESIVEKNIAN